jgi:NADPH-dependent 2,4-dienoyl-CoA reductase/sulfur reductase-like enzyme
MNSDREKVKIVVIGGVAAGMSAAAKIRRGDPFAQIVVLEQSGEISYGACGLPYYISGITPREDLLRIRSVEDFRRLDIQIRLHCQAQSIDTMRKRVMVRNVSDGYCWEEAYDKLVIASGASPVVPNVEGKNLKNVFTLRSIEDANKIRAALEWATRTVIIGGGPIGLELAENLLKLGKKVSIVEQGAHFLPKISVSLSTLVEEELRKSNVELFLGEPVRRLRAYEGWVCAVQTPSHDIPAELVIFATGVRPNTTFCQGNDFQMLDNGALVVDCYLRTSLPDIYAGGDCASVYHKLLKENCYLPLGTYANRQGRLIGENVLGKQKKYPGALGTTMLQVLGLEIAWTGITEGQGRQKGWDLASVEIRALNHAPYYPDPEPIWIHLVFDRTSETILGAQLVGGPGTALRGDVLAACIDRGMTLEELGQLDLGYAPPFSCVWDGLLVAANASRRKD